MRDRSIERCFAAASGSIWMKLAVADKSGEGIDPRLVNLDTIRQADLLSYAGAGRLAGAGYLVLPYSPLNCGVRFSKKAVTPSRKSFVPKVSRY